MDTGRRPTRADAVTNEGAWVDVLASASRALRGRRVSVWESDGEGRIWRVAASDSADSSESERRGLSRAMRRWNVDRARRRRWMASHIGPDLWCIAPVRQHPPQPPVMDADRRSPERMILELAGACIGMLDRERSTRAISAPDEATLRDTMRALEDFFEHVPIGLHWMARDGTILRANREACEMLGVPAEEFVGRKIDEFYVDHAAVHDIEKRALAGEDVRNVEARLHHKNGTIIRALVSASAGFEEGRFVHIRVATRDLGDVPSNGGALAQFQAMVESAHDAIIGKTLDGIVTYWNPAATRQYGYTAEEMIGKSIGVLIPPHLPNELPRILESLKRGMRVENYQTVRVRKDGERIHVSVTVSPILDVNGRPIGGSSIARDISERIAVEQQLRHGALHDSLTGLPNRVFFNERVAESLARMRRDPGYRFAVLFLDFDDFKVVNDSVGHAAGDQLLQRIAARLPGCVRPGDVIARLGGDEFTVLLEEPATRESVEIAARRVHTCLAAPFQVGDRRVEVTASIGAAVADTTYERPEDLLRDADIAMYHAKRTGHGRFQVFDVVMRDWAHARFSMTTDLRRAVERGELALVFQPICDLASGRVRSFEALVRWNHPTRGLVLPDDFIPLAEQTGLIVPIGEWVLINACAHARRWQAEAPAAGPVSVSVNLSAKQIGDARIINEVRRALESTGLNPRALRLEITETVLVENGEAATSQLEALRALDVELHVDDFGTGYSWLSYLPRFPLQAIKVDRSFVRRMGTRRTDVEIVRSIIDLATTLGLQVIAEGIETPGQRERLIAFGCELGQGFLFSKPVDSSETLPLLKRAAFGLPLPGRGKSPAAGAW
ncbi:MAG: putative bifunctional diguanylate cyclase/phosphodiesterase [Gemmatimonadaceae bacterium]